MLILFISKFNSSTFKLAYLHNLYSEMIRRFINSWIHTDTSQHETKMLLL